MAFWKKLTAYVGWNSVHEAAGSGRRSRVWNPGDPGAVSAMLATGNQLRVKSRDLVRRNAWAANAVDSFVSNAIGTGIKPQSLVDDPKFREKVHALWWQWVEEADSNNLTDFYGLQSLACRAMVEGGECLIRIRNRRQEDGLSVPIQLQILEPEHLPLSLNTISVSGNPIRSGIEFDALGRRVAYHLYREHPGDPSLTVNGNDLVPVPAEEIVHLFRPLRPGQIRGEPWLSRALVKLNELDQYDDAELVRKKTAAMFAGFITRQSPEDQLLGEGEADELGVAMTGLEPGTLQVLEPGEDVKFSDPADVGGSYAEFLRVQFRAVAVAMGITYEQLTGDLSGVNYSSIRAGLLEFRRRCEAIQHGVIVHQMCRPIWRAWMDAAVLSGALTAQGYAKRIEFWGGEPLVYIKTLRPLAEALRQRYPDASFSIVTNGSLLNPEVNTWLDVMGFGVGVSHDGPGQPARGPDPLDDEASREGIMDLYRRLAPQGRISFNAMVHRTNTSREEIAKFFLQLTGDPSLSIGEGSFVDPYDVGGLANSIQSEQEAFEFRRQSLEEIRRGRIVHLDVARSRMQEWARSILERRPASVLGQKCGMDAANQVAVDLMGNVLTCQNVSAVAVAPNGQSHHIGHLSNLKAVALNTSTHWSKRTECLNCPVLQACKGACMFLEGPLWTAACDNAYSDHVPFFVAAIEHLTGCAVYRIEGDLPEGRADVFGLKSQDQRSPRRKFIPIEVSNA